LEITSESYQKLKKGGGRGLVRSRKASVALGIPRFSNKKRTRKKGKASKHRGAAPEHERGGGSKDKGKEVVIPRI